MMDDKLQVIVKNNNESEPLISIITVCFNSAKTIRRTIESVLNQTYTNIEYIIVDGKSTDNTLEIIKEYESQFAEQGIIYRYVSEPDSGIYDAMNKGIKIAVGEWINIQGSDDWLELSACYDVATTVDINQHVDMIYGITRLVDGDNVVGLSQSSIYNIRNTPINHQAIFMKSSVHKVFGLYSFNYKIYSDWDFLLKICHKIEVLRIEKVVANYSLMGISSLPPKFNKDLLNFKYNHGMLSRNKYYKKIISGYLKQIFAKIKF